MRREERQRGISLVELLVSITILALATTVALVIYDRARLAYKHGVNVTEQQQVARVAFDVLTSDIRMAGFNTDPDGNRGRPDEQLEAAFATAITVRADYDADDPIEVDLPEQGLAGTGSAFATVSTGNDEIVSYVLAKPDGTSKETLAFNADVGDPVRDGSIEAIRVGRVDLSQADPPYTLYKVVLENDPSGCCGTSFSRRMPIVDNVRSLRFRYFDRAGIELAPPGGDETAEAVATRAAVRRIGVEVVALTRDADPHWLDADDADPDTRQFRKFRLDGEIAPPNLGRGAIPDLQADLTPPGTPATPSLYPGHCGGLTDETPYYVSPPGPTDLITTANTNTPARVAALNATGTTGQIDRYKVTAVDACGVEGSSSDEVAAQSWSDVDPMAPDGVQAHYGALSGVRVSWSAVYEDVNGGAGYIDAYKIYRSTLQDSSLPPAVDFAYLDQVANVTEYVDPITIPTGQTAYYTVQAADRCLPPNESAPSVAADPSCAFSGHVVIRQPQPNEDVSGSEAL